MELSTQSLYHITHLDISYCAAINITPLTNLRDTVKVLIFRGNECNTTSWTDETLSTILTLRNLIELNVSSCIEDLFTYRPVEVDEFVQSGRLAHLENLDLG